MKIRKLLYAIIAAATFVACSDAADSTKVLAENQSYSVYAKTDEGQSAELWSLDKVSGKESLILVCHPSRWIESDSVISICKDSIPAAESVKILSYDGQPLKLLIEEKQDQRNVTSYIFTVGQDSVLRLPTNAGLVGLTDEDDLLVMQTFEYYYGGGRYNQLQVYDKYGRLHNTLDLKVHPEREK